MKQETDDMAAYQLLGALEAEAEVPNVDGLYRTFTRRRTMRRVASVVVSMAIVVGLLGFSASFIGGGAKSTVEVASASDQPATASSAGGQQDPPLQRGLLLSELFELYAESLPLIDDVSVPEARVLVLEVDDAEGSAGADARSTWLLTEVDDGEGKPTYQFTSFRDGPPLTPTQVLCSTTAIGQLDQDPSTHVISLAPENLEDSRAQLGCPEQAIDLPDPGVAASFRLFATDEGIIMLESGDGIVTLRVNPEWQGVGTNDADTSVVTSAVTPPTTVITPSVDGS